MSKFEIKTLEMAGFASALQALRLPYGKECRSEVSASADVIGDSIKTHSMATINGKDLSLMSALVKRGDEHAKVLRGVVVWAEITAPRYWWQEMATYRIGTETLSSTSTMHCECKGLSGEALEAAKGALTEDTTNTRILTFSYQALRRIYFQRRNHRLPSWHKFCEWIELLPYAKELITIG